MNRDRARYRSEWRAKKVAAGCCQGCYKFAAGEEIEGEPGTPKLCGWCAKRKRERTRINRTLQLAHAGDVVIPRPKARGPRYKLNAQADTTGRIERRFAIIALEEKLKRKA